MCKLRKLFVKQTSDIYYSNFFLILKAKNFLVISNPHFITKVVDFEKQQKKNFQNF